MNEEICKRFARPTQDIGAPWVQSYKAAPDNVRDQIRIAVGVGHDGRMLLIQDTRRAQ